MINLIDRFMMTLWEDITIWIEKSVLILLLGLLVICHIHLIVSITLTCQQKDKLDAAFPLQIPITKGLLERSSQRSMQRRKTRCIIRVRLKKFAKT